MYDYVPLHGNASERKVACAYLRFYISQSWREMKHHKCSFCWGVVGCFLVSLIIPIVLNLATRQPEMSYSDLERRYGKTDLTLSSAHGTEIMSLNATRAKEILDPLGKEYSMCTPRAVVRFADGRYFKRRIYGKFSAVNSKLEKQYDLGWKSSYNSIPKGKIVIDLFSSFNFEEFKVGNVVNLFLNMSQFSPIAFDVVKKQAPTRLLEAVKYLQNFTVPFEIAEVLTSDNGIFRDKTFYAEIDNVWEHIVEYLPRSVLEIVDIEHFREAKLNDYATELDCNLQVPRNKTYLHADSSITTRKLNSWSTNILYALNFAELYAELWGLRDFGSSFESVMILPMGMMVVMLLAITILIIYSQIQRSVDGRAYELGLMRVHGMGRFGVVMLIVIQAFTFAIPGIIFGIIGAQGINVALIYLITKDTDMHLTVMLSPWSVIFTILVVLAATLVASFFPIKTALSTNLHDSIDVQHTNTSAVLITIERSDSIHSSSTLLVDGLILTVIGACVYLLFPLSLASGNMVLMIILLIGLVICVMTALVLIFVNFEYIFEAVVSTVFLFWEKKAVRKMALKNLSLHRLRNRGTTIMFALILCFVFTGDILTNTILESSNASVYEHYACDLEIQLFASYHEPIFNEYENWNGSIFFPPPLFNSIRKADSLKMQDVQIVQAVLDEYKDVIESYAYVSNALSQQQGGREASVMMTNRGRTYQSLFDLMAVSPNYKAATDEKVWHIKSTLNDKKKMTGDDVMRQLYVNYFDSSMAIISQDFKKQLRSNLGDKYVLTKNLSAAATYYLPFYSNTLFNEMDKDSAKKENEIVDGRTDTISLSSIFKNITIGGFVTSFPYPYFYFSYNYYVVSLIPVSIPFMCETIDNINGVFASPAFDDLYIYSIKIKYKKGASSSRTDSLVRDISDVKFGNSTSLACFIDSNSNSQNPSNRHCNCEEREEFKENTDDKRIKQIINKESAVSSTLYNPKKADSFVKSLKKQPLLRDNNVFSSSSFVDNKNPYLRSDIWTKKSFDEGNAFVEVMMHSIFAASALFMSFLGECSLVAAMSSNVLSSKKDYGMMRSMGMSQFQTRRVYIEEAFILVMAASVMGMVSGMLLSYMVSSQIVLLLSYGKPVFYFPYVTLISLVFVSMLMGYLSTSAPLSYLRHIQIADCMRSL
ncbi:putative DUF214 family protein [Monocercomonoides exilis]|uniref:putative DUF214 family protein n=1 Tax=Monocercomonoides exilis TaxID=2049356 RepID=UPI00355A6404|nr:putative DUF214 family protein [Monocercomonoides exilis]|eukprot:MONOS_2497.1-p1 / transcript=MONOS_2497.1 / gene=MONOS_2497 / organism=Monocercomonoides_exilis_PA203 / gene_product=DUF214 family protein / transcript_product=DUF214 family protein / location=Mono_scaffold00052:32075-36147(-) / protein_length=1158 / sequence_SO=supercontig / SO=protein_coding / is_pseudo=false